MTRRMRLLAGQVESGDRLVEQQQSRCADQRLGNQHPLALASRQLAERTAHEVDDLQAFADATDLLTIVPGDPPEQSAPSIAPHPEHLLDGKRHPVVVAVLLCDERRFDSPGAFDRSRRG